MYLIIPIIFAIPGIIAAASSVIIPIAGVVGGLIVAPAVIKACGNAVSLVKDGKVGLEAQQVIKKISDYDEQIGTIIIEKNIEFENDIFTNEIVKIRENMKKIEEKETEIIKAKNDKK